MYGEADIGQSVNVRFHGYTVDIIMEESMHMNGTSDTELVYL
jgi:hypothetical protein